MLKEEIDKIVGDLTKGYPNNLIKDIRQDAYLIIYDLLDRFKGTSREKGSYIYTVTKHRLRDALKQYRGFEEEILDDCSLYIPQTDGKDRIGSYIDSEKVLSVLDDVEREIYEAVFTFQFTEEEVAHLYQDLTGIATQQGINKYINRIKLKLNDSIRIHNLGEEPSYNSEASQQQGS